MDEKQKVLIDKRIEHLDALVVSGLEGLESAEESIKKIRDNIIRHEVVVDLRKREVEFLKSLLEKD